MKVVLQRVSQASVSVDKEVVGAIGQGYLVLLGVSNNDGKLQVAKMVDKISKLRIFPDENGKINLSIAEVKGAILVVSQFTLYADCKKGNRPSFVNAGSPEVANELYEYFVQSCQDKFAKVAQGIFGASMQVSSVNDGPFTLVLEID